MLILSPRAVERLESYTPPWPLPKIFRMTKGGKLIEGIFEGETINTPSMLCVEDYHRRARMGEGARRARRPDRAGRRQRRGDPRLGRHGRPGSRILARIPATALQHHRLPRRSPTRTCSPRATRRRRRFAKGIAATLETEGVAFDIGAYRDAPPGLRIWCGATVETRRPRGADALARLGLRAGEGEARESGLTAIRRHRRREPGRSAASDRSTRAASPSAASMAARRSRRPDDAS